MSDLVPGGICLSVDAMGGDKGPKPVIAGIAKFLNKEPTARVILHGPAKELKPLIKRRLRDKITLSDATEVVAMEDKPSQVMRRGEGTSMWAAVDAVRSKEAAACVSCGNTGALMAISMLRLRKAPGVDRPAIACLWPSKNPAGFNVMLDVGADIRAEAKDLLAYAHMGSSYARNGLDVARPRVGLLNVGTEDHKGRPEIREAGELIEAAASERTFDYVGFVEGGDIPSDKVDVIVSDGFSGNIALKTGEGTASLISTLLREAFMKTALSRIAALMAQTSLQRLRKRIDPRRVNGGVFLGLNGIVVKSHGAADATGWAAALKLAHRLASASLVDRVEARVAGAQGKAQGAASQGDAEASSN